MKLKNIKEHFHVTPYNDKGEYLLYKNGLYSGTIIYDAKKETVDLKSPITYKDEDGEEYNRMWQLNKGSKIDVLFEYIEEMDKSLPFPLSCYNPTYRKGWFIESCIHHYLTNIGFEQCMEGFYKNTVYKLTNANACGFDGNLTFIISTPVVFSDDVNGNITMYISHKKSLSFNFNDLDSAIKTINGMMKLAFASSMVYMVKKSKMIMDNEINLDGVELHEKDTNNPFNTYVTEVKQQTIEFLENMLAELKNS